jgi:hypothetical protein
MLNLLALESNQKENVTAIFRLLQEKYNAELDNDHVDLFNDHMADFELVREFNAFSIKNIFRIPDGNHSHYVIIAYAADVALGKTKTHIKADCITYVYTELSKSAGRVMIRPERLSDKIVDLFTKRDLDFDSHPDFSRKYYLTTSNKALTNRMFSYDFLESVNNFKKIFLEILDDRFIITYKTEIAPDKIIPLVEFVKKADNLLKV